MLCVKWCGMNIFLSTLCYLPSPFRKGDKLGYDLAVEDPLGCGSWVASPLPPSFMVEDHLLGFSSPEPVRRHWRSTVASFLLLIIIIIKQLISSLVIFSPTTKDIKVSIVLILPPENLRCHCWGGDVQNNLCFKPAVPLHLQYWPLQSQVVPLLQGYRSSRLLRWKISPQSWNIFLYTTNIGTVLACAS